MVKIIKKRFIPFIRRDAEQEGLTDWTVDLHYMNWVRSYLKITYSKLNARCMSTAREKNRRNIFIAHILVRHYKKNTGVRNTFKRKHLGNMQQKNPCSCASTIYITLRTISSFPTKKYWHFGLSKMYNSTY